MFLQKKLQPNTSSNTLVQFILRAQKGDSKKKVGARGKTKRKKTFWQRCMVLLSPTTTHIGRHTGATISENTTAEREGGKKEGKGTKKTMVSSRAKSWRTAVEHTDNLSAFFWIVCVCWRPMSTSKETYEIPEETSEILKEPCKIPKETCEILKEASEMSKRHMKYSKRPKKYMKRGLWNSKRDLRDTKRDLWNTNRDLRVVHCDVTPALLNTLIQGTGHFL